MEVAGLAIGIAPLASLCLEFLERARDFRDYKASSRQLNARFEIAKSRLKVWTREVGIVDGNLIDPHHTLLDQPEVKRVVELVLHCLFNNFGSSIEDAELAITQRHRQAEVAPPGWKPLQRSNTSKLEKSGRSAKNAFFWATGHKAAFTEQVEIFEILVERLHDVVPLDTTDRPVTSVTEALDRIKLTQEEMLVLIQQMRRDALHRKTKAIHEWLDVPTTDQDFDKHLTDRLQGTCDWIAKKEAYLAWEDDHFPGNNAKLFWLCAPPGHGKTVLAAALVQRIKSLKKSPVAYFFSEPHVRSGSSVYAIIRSWISQLAGTDELIFELVYDRTITSSLPKTTKVEVLKLFREILLMVSDCTLILDGYDEFDRQDDMRKGFLQELKCNIASSKARLLIASRPEDDIAVELQFPNTEPGLFLSGHRISSGDLQADIALYSRAVVTKQLPNKDQTFQQELADRMISKCDGMFLWIKLQKLELRGGKSKRDLREIVDRMPEGLTRSYARTWDDIMARSTYDRGRAVEILRWTCFAARSLTIEELTEALVHEYGAKSPCRDGMPDAIDDEYIEGEIKGLCGSFIEVRKDVSDEDGEAPASYCVHLVHTSAKEFLVANLTAPLPYTPKSSEASEHAIHHVHLAEVCLRYISCDDSWESAFTNPEDTQPVFGKRFMKYAATRWWLHCREANMMSDEYRNLTSRFFAFDSPHFSRWTENDVHYQTAWTERRHEVGFNVRLYFAVLYELPHVVEHLHACGKLDFSTTTCSCGTALSVAVSKQGSFFDDLLSWGAEINEMGGRDGSALGAAVLCGNLDRIKALLQRGADLKIRDWKGRPILTLACWKDILAVVKLLLDHGADPSDYDDVSTSPLFWCIDRKNGKTVRLLLEHGASITVVDRNGESALHHACHYNNVEVVEALIDQGANMLQRTKWGLTTLNVAAAAGQSHVARILLQREPKLLTLCGDSNNYPYPIHSAAHSNDVETIKVLMEYGAALNQQTRYGSTPLHFACYNNNQDEVEAIEFLIRNGADVSCRDQSQWTPLHMAVRQGRPNATKILLANGADISSELSENDYYYLPIHYAAWSKSIETMQVLLEHGADVNIASVESWATPLHCAARSADLNMIRYLIEKGADFFAVDAYGYTPFQVACESGDMELVKFCLEKGGKASSRTKLGWTPLHAVCTSRSVQAVSLLLENGADPFQQSDRGWTSLHAACGSGSKEIVTFLIEKGADALQSENQGRTPLHLACMNKRSDALDIVKLLLEKGADVSQRTSGGYTALHFACESTSNSANQVIDLLLERGADPAHRTDADVTPLHEAAKSGNLKAIQTLLDRGAQLPGYSGPNTNNWHLMHFAVLSGKPDVIQFFIDRKVPINPQSRLKQTPVNLGVVQNYDAVVEKLIDAGADMVTFIWNGLTTIEWIERKWPKHPKIQQWKSAAKCDLTSSDRVIRVKQKMIDIAQDALLVEKYVYRSRWPLFNYLAIQFWLLGARSDFLFASQQTVLKKSLTGQRIHHETCSSCSQKPIVGERWICFTCPMSATKRGVEFCGSCKTKLLVSENKTFSDCGNHDLVLTPCYEGEDLDYEDDRARDPEVKSWLEAVITRYEAEDYPASTQPLIH